MSRLGVRRTAKPSEVRFDLLRPQRRKRHARIAARVGSCHFLLSRLLRLRIVICPTHPYTCQGVLHHMFVVSPESIPRVWEKSRGSSTFADRRSWTSPLGGFWGMREGVSLLCHDAAVWGVVCWRCGRFPHWQRRGGGWFWRFASRGCRFDMEGV